MIIHNMSLYFEVDEFSGRMLYATDGCPQRWKQRDTWNNNTRDSYNNSAVFDEQRVINRAQELIDQGYQPDPTITLEEWVERMSVSKDLS